MDSHTKKETDEVTKIKEKWIERRTELRVVSHMKTTTNEEKKQ